MDALKDKYSKLKTKWREIKDQNIEDPVWNAFKQMLQVTTTTAAAATSVPPPPPELELAILEARYENEIAKQVVFQQQFLEYKERMLNLQRENLFQEFRWNNEKDRHELQMKVLQQQLRPTSPAYSSRSPSPEKSTMNQTKKK